jgi:hypothetical protein
MSANRQIVIVVWDDAHGSAHREVTEDDMPHRPTIMQTVGWLLRHDETGVSIANEYCCDADSTCYRGHTFVPAGMIRSVTPFNLTIPRKPRHAKVDPQSLSAVAAASDR